MAFKFWLIICHHHNIFSLNGSHQYDHDQNLVLINIQVCLYTDCLIITHYWVLPLPHVIIQYHVCLFMSFIRCHQIVMSSYFAYSFGTISIFIPYSKHAYDTQSGSISILFIHQNCIVL